MITIVITIKMEKRKKIPLMIKKTMGIKTLYLTEGKIRIRQGFKSGNWGIRVIAPSVSDFFCFVFQLKFLIAKRCHSSRKSD